MSVKEVKEQGFLYMQKYIDRNIGELLEMIDVEIKKSDEVGLPKNILYLDEDSYALLRGYLKDNLRENSHIRGMKITTIGKSDKRKVYISS